MSLAELLNKSNQGFFVIKRAYADEYYTGRRGQFSSTKPPKVYHQKGHANSAITGMTEDMFNSIRAAAVQPLRARLYRKEISTDQYYEEIAKLDLKYWWELSAEEKQAERAARFTLVKLEVEDGKFKETPV